jgi:hypothetical protein
VKEGGGNWGMVNGMGLRLNWFFYRNFVRERVVISLLNMCML